MTILKDERATRLDDLHRSLAETLGLYEDLAERIDDAELRGLVNTQILAQRRVLERAAELRRAQGELPQAADPERSHLEAAGAFVRAIVLPGETTSHYVESLLTAASGLRERLGAARQVDLEPELDELLEGFMSENDAFMSALRTRL